MTTTASAGARGGRRGVRALVYGDVNMNVLDGSAVWAASVVEVFALAGCEVTLLLKAPVTTTRLLDPLLAMPQVRIVRPWEERLVHDSSGGLLTPAEAARLMRRLDEEDRFDLAVLRGSRVLRRVVDDGHFRRRIWTYLTDFPQAVTELTPQAQAGLATIAEASRVVLCQTEEIRSFLESTVPEVSGKGFLFTPVVPDVGEPPGRDPFGDRPLRLVYSGKFAPLWKTEEMTALPGRLAERGLRVELHVVGDKIHQVADDPGFQERMRSALAGTPGVVWHGGRSRQETMAITAGCDVGMSWRDRALDASLELSTKVLEYGAVGLPVLLNRTPMHEDLLGPDYPLFVGADGDPVEAIALVATDPATYAVATERCRAAAEGFSRRRAVARLEALLARIFPAAPALAARPRELRVGVASHDLKFFTRLLDHLEDLPGVAVRVDQWARPAKHDEAQSRALLQWADVVICEWCAGNAVWYSKHKRRDQRLIVRLHRFELNRPWPGEVDIGAVDQVVCVAPHYAAVTQEQTGWPAERIAVIPNWVDDEQLDRPKLPGAPFHLGIIGVGDRNKRVDLALDVLERLRAEDERYVLYVKTKMPWDYPWVWDAPGELEHLDEVLRRIQTSPRLRGAVAWDRFGPDVGTWLRRVGWVLSTSDQESFHLAPCEGMASRAIPVVRERLGAADIFDRRWIHEGPDEMAASILATNAGGRWKADGDLAHEQVREAFGLRAVADAWAELLTTDLPPCTAA